MNNNWRANYERILMEEAQRNSAETAQQNLYEDMMTELTGLKNKPEARKRLIGLSKLNSAMHRMAVSGEQNSNNYKTRKAQRNRLQEKLYNETEAEFNENYIASMELPNDNLSRIMKEEHNYMTATEESEKILLEEQARAALEQAKKAEENAAKAAANAAKAEANRKAALNRARYERYAKKRSRKSTRKLGRKSRRN